jgi:RNA polymerase sigma-70 factor (TIGR02960 family)
VAAELLIRARSGDGDAFRDLTEPHLGELRAHCYRMLGCLQDAEDVLQETLLAAWQGLDGFEGRASIRTWLYRIATNRCLNSLRSAQRRPAGEWQMPEINPPRPTRLGEVVWLEPYPQALLEGAIDRQPGPEARYEQTEAISLAFVTALQRLPARQRAAIILCDVLGYRAAEVADLLDSTVPSVNSALKRARARLHVQLRPDEREGAPPAGSPAERALAARFVSAYQAGDVEGLISLLTTDVLVSMPPVPLQYQGREAAAGFFAAIFAGGRWAYELVPTMRANGQPAFGAYLRDGARPAASLLVLELRGALISAVTGFESSWLPRFGLPLALLAGPENEVGQ